AYIGAIGLHTNPLARLTEMASSLECAAAAGVNSMKSPSQCQAHLSTGFADATYESSSSPPSGQPGDKVKGAEFYRNVVKYIWENRTDYHLG
ncbi:13680_t:CDS:2, partial [Acaulospora colombiana]